MDWLTEFLLDVLELLCGKVRPFLSSEERQELGLDLCLCADFGACEIHVPGQCSLLKSGSELMHLLILIINIVR